MNISIIIPTMNRPKLLLRLIRYYAAQEFQGEIIIGDSSSLTIFQEVNSVLTAYQNSLNINHYHLPGRSVAAAVQEMNAYVTTAYVCLVGDDDFIVPAAITQCIQFLDNHFDYVAAHGLGALIYTASNESGFITNAELYPQTIIEEATAASRLSKHLADYSVSLFAIHRIEVWRKMFMNTPSQEKSPECGDKSFVSELLPCCLSVVYGKIKQIDGLYLVRQAHKERYCLPTWFSWLNSECWHPSYLYFREQLAQAIAAEDSIELSQAKDIIDSAFSVYLSSVVNHGERVLNLVHKTLLKFSVLRRLWHVLRRFCLPTKITSLSSLLNPASIYHQDFSFIYSAVVGGNEIKK